MGGIPSQVIFRTLPADANGNFPGDPGYVAGGSGGAAASGSTNTSPRAPVAVSTSSTALVVSSTTARALSFASAIANTGAVALCYGATASVANAFYTLLPGGLYESPVATTAAVSGISLSGTNNIVSVEFLP